MAGYGYQGRYSARDVVPRDLPSLGTGWGNVRISAQKSDIAAVPGTT
jgi:hypothetical protein